MSHTHKLLAWLFAVLGTAPVSAQFINRATWLGVDDEETRSSFHRGVEYFMDRMSYVDAPPWWDRGLRRFENRIDYRLGSVSTRVLTIEGVFDHSVDLGGGASFRYHMLQSENRDTRFLRNAVELEYALGPETAVFVQGEVLQDKSLIDASVGAWLWRRDNQALRLMLTAVDLPSEKSRRVVYERDPYAVMLAGVFGNTDGHRVAFEIGGQLPLTLHDLDAMTTVELHRWIGSVESHVRLGGSDWLVAAAELEWTDKSREPDPASSATAEDFRRDFLQYRVEWWHDSTMPWSVGFSNTRLDEDGIVRGDPASDLRTRRDEWFGIARLHIPVGEQLSFEPQILAGHVRQAFRDSNVDRHIDRFEGKLSWNTRWDFSANARVVLLVTVQLDELAFGGGGLQFVARF